MFTGNRFCDNDVPLVISGRYDIDSTNVFHSDSGSEPVGNTYNGIFGGGWDGVGDVVWSTVDVPFVIAERPLEVAAGSSLTLGDGVIVKFDAGERIGVAGTLTADATSEILFTSLRDDSAGGDTNGDGTESVLAPGDWGWLDLSGSGSLLRRCRGSYAGSGLPYSGAVMVSHSATATIEECTFAHNAGGTLEDNRAAALNLGEAAAGTEIHDNVFYDNAMPLVINGLINVEASNVFHELGSDTPATNTYNGIFMDGVLHVVEGSTTWTNQEVPYVMGPTTLGVDEGATLTLGDSVVLKFEGSRIDVAGAIVQGDNCVFTSLRDESLLGDTNGDGVDTTPMDGDWQGINFCLGGPCEWAAWGNILYASYPE